MNAKFQIYLFVEVDLPVNSSIITSRIFRISIVLILMLSSVSCTRFANFARSRADRAGYKIIAEKQQQELGQAQEFSIEHQPGQATQSLLNNTDLLDRSIDTVTTPTYLLPLSDTLAIAFANNREYHQRRETMFRQALSLTESRRDFSSIFTASGDASYTRVDDNGQVERFGAAGASTGVTNTLITGARVAADFTHDYSRQFGRGLSNKTSSYAMGLSVVQPLLRGAGPLVSHEPLRQAERDMIYEVRSFQRFQQNFMIEITSAFFNLLSSRDALQNAKSRLLSAKESFLRTRAESDAELKAPFEVDQAEQALLEAENRFNTSQTRYLNELDRFKIRLGLPVELDFGPDPMELQSIMEKGLVVPDISIEEAIDYALSNRLDLKTTIGNQQDAERAVKIALRNFLPKLDIGYGLDTKNSNRNAGDDSFLTDNTQVWSINLDLPLDWTPRRNNYRNALIGLEQAKRNVAQEQDQIVLDVKSSWRELSRTLKEYEIQRKSVTLAARRVQRANLQLESGRFTTRDLLEAQDDLLDARNALTNALVSYTIQRLRFWDAIEKLKIDPKGMWYE